MTVYVFLTIRYREVLFVIIRPNEHLVETFDEEFKEGGFDALFGEKLSNGGKWILFGRIFSPISVVLILQDFATRPNDCECRYNRNSGLVCLSVVCLSIYWSKVLTNNKDMDSYG